MSGVPEGGGVLQVTQAVQRDLGSEDVQEPDDLDGREKQDGRQETPVGSPPTPSHAEPPYVLVLHVLEEPQLSVRPFGE